MTISKITFYKFKLAQLATRWRKTEDDILTMLEAGEMPAYCWHKGYAYSLLQKPKEKARFHEGWVSVDQRASNKLRLGEKAELSSFSLFIAPPDPVVPKLYQRAHDETDVLFPMRQINNNPPKYSEAPFPVSKADLFVMGHDVERMEEQNPELYAASLLGEPVEGQLPTPCAPNLSVPQSTTEIKTPTPPKGKLGRKNRLTLALEHAREHLIHKTGNEPTVTAIIESVQEGDHTGAIMGLEIETDGKQYLEWEDWSGKAHRAVRRTVENKISKIRRKNDKL